MIHDAFRINRILHNDMDWDVFRSEVCHMYDSEPDIFFIEDVLRTNLIEALILNKWYEKALYILAMIDYVASKNKMPFYPDYDYLRTVKLPHIIFPKEVLLLDSINNTNINKEKAIKDCKDHPCGKFFWRHNIIETYIENMNKQKGFIPKNTQTISKDMACDILQNKLNEGYNIFNLGPGVDISKEISVNKDDITFVQNNQEKTISREEER